MKTVHATQIAGFVALLLGAVALGSGLGNLAAHLTAPTTVSPGSRVQGQRAPAGAAQVAASPTRQKPEDSAPHTAEGLLRTMSLDRKIGQMLMVGFRGASARPASAMVRSGHVGGVILFRENLRREEAVARMVGRIQRAAWKVDGAQVLVATDEEGGRVERLGRVGAPFSRTNERWGRLWAADHEEAESGVRRQAAETAARLLALGINMNLAPVLDVLTERRNPIIGATHRSYGRDAGCVDALGATYIGALQDAGIIATAKHFPGHGATTSDSHETRPVVSLDVAAMETHLAPFRSAVRNGVDAVMLAHVVYPAYDASEPASLSTRIVSMLREDLGFDGVILTDDMGMQAIAAYLTPEQAAVEAVRAGVDIVLLGQRDAPDLGRIREALRRAALRDPDIAQHIEAAAARILRLKEAHGLLDPPADAVPGTPH